MMKPVDPAELSGLMDGELTPQRAAEVRRAIAQDESLRQTYQQMTALDARLRKVAAGVTFRANLALAGSAGPQMMVVVLGAIGLLLVRIAAKLVSPLVGNGLELVVLAAVVAWVLVHLARQSEKDCVPSAGCGSLL